MRRRPRGCTVLAPAQLLLSFYHRRATSACFGSYLPLARAGLEGAATRAGLDVDAQWFDRLARDRMDGHPIVKALTSCLLAVENRLGNGLFINLLLARSDAGAGLDRS